MGGHHHHGSDTGQGVRRALRWALALNGGFLVIEAAVGWLTGSLALLSDAAHMVGDVGAIALALGAAHLARRAATPSRSWGFARAEILGAFINGLALLVACVFIFRAAIHRLVGGPPHVDAMPVLVVGIVGLLINLGSAWVLYRADHENLNVRGALLHMLADALGSVGAIVAAILLTQGLRSADAVVSIVIGALVLATTWGLLRDSGRILLQFAPMRVEVGEVAEALLEIEGLVDVHDLHIWTLDGSRIVLTAHLVSSEDRSAEEIRDRAADLLRERFDIDHTTLQSESLQACTHPGCPLVPGEQVRHVLS